MMTSHAQMFLVFLWRTWKDFLEGCNKVSREIYWLDHDEQRKPFSDFGGQVLSWEYFVITKCQAIQQIILQAWLCRWRNFGNLSQSNNLINGNYRVSVFQGKFESNKMKVCQMKSQIANALLLFHQEEEICLYSGYDGLTSTSVLYMIIVSGADMEDNLVPGLDS